MAIVLLITISGCHTVPGQTRGLPLRKYDNLAYFYICISIWLQFMYDTAETKTLETANI
jgi:hypothetical protein